MIAGKWYRQLLPLLFIAFSYQLSNGMETALAVAVEKESILCITGTQIFQQGVVDRIKALIFYKNRNVQIITEQSKSCHVNIFGMRWADLYDSEKSKEYVPQLFFVATQDNNDSYTVYVQERTLGGGKDSEIAAKAREHIHFGNKEKALKYIKQIKDVNIDIGTPQSPLSLFTRVITQACSIGDPKNFAGWDPKMVKQMTDSWSDVVVLCIKKGANINVLQRIAAKDSEVSQLVGDNPVVMTPLHVACVADRNAGKEREKIGKLLVEAGAQVNIPDDQGNTPLHYAVFSDFTPMIFYLINDCNADVTILNNRNRSPLDLYIDRKSKDRRRNDQGRLTGLMDWNDPVLQTMLKKVQTITVGAGALLLELAIWQDNEEIVKLLLAMGANPTATNLDLLHDAVSKPGGPHRGIIKRLLGAGAEPHLRTMVSALAIPDANATAKLLLKKAETALLHEAVEANDLTVVSFLLGQKVDPSQDKRLVKSAYDNRNLPMLRLLIAAQAPIAGISVDSLQSLVSDDVEDAEDIFTLLLANGALSAEGKKELLRCAVDNMHLPIITELLKAGVALTPDYLNYFLNTAFSMEGGSTSGRADKNLSEVAEDMVSRGADPMLITSEIYVKLPSEIQEFVQKKMVSDARFVKLAATTSSLIIGGLPENVCEKLETAGQAAAFKKIVVTTLIGATVLPFFLENTTEVVNLRQQFVVHMAQQLTPVLQNRTYFNPKQGIFEAAEIATILQNEFIVWKKARHQERVARYQAEKEKKEAREHKQKVESRLQDQEKLLLEQKKESKRRERKLKGRIEDLRDEQAEAAERAEELRRRQIEEIGAVKKELVEANQELKSISWKASNLY